MFTTDAGSAMTVENSCRSCALQSVWRNPAHRHRSPSPAAAILRRKAAAGQAPRPSPTRQARAPAAPAAPPQAAPAQPTDPFGEDTTLTAKPIVYVKGTGTWDNAFETITNSFKTIKAYINKEGLKIDGQPMTIFTSTDDTGFQFQAAIPIAEPPKNPPQGRHRRRHFAARATRSNSSIADRMTAWTIPTRRSPIISTTKRLEAKDMFIEQYLTDPLTANEDHLVVNVYVLIK